MSDNSVLSALARLEAGLGRLEAGQERLEAGQQRVEARLERLESRVEGLESRVEGLESRVEGLECRVERLEAGQERLRVDVMVRIDRLQNNVTATRDDINVTFARAEKAHEAVDTTRSELRGLTEMTSVMWRQLKALEARVREITGDA